MLTIELTNLRFFAFHGLYEEEKKIGGEFTVNVFVTYLPVTFPVTDINETIDYTAIYQLVKEKMQQREDLLETVASNIADSIFKKFLKAESVSVAIKKMNPPIIAFEGNVGIKYAASRNKNP